MYEELDNSIITSYERYDKELAWYNKEMNDVGKIKNLTDPIASYKHFMAILDRAEKIELFDKEYCDKYRKKLIDGMNDINLKEKFKQQLRKRGLIK